jgi:DNA-binding beta-propeller fold protein YncE
MSGGRRVIHGVGLAGALSLVALIAMPGVAAAAIQNAYVANFGSNNVSQYGLGPGGALTPKDPATVAAGLSPWAIAVSPNEASAYVANLNEDNLYQYDAEPGGTLTPKLQTTVGTGGDPFAIAIHPDGASAYVPNFSTNNLSQYDIDPGDGELTPDDPATVATGQAPTAVAVHPNGESVYVTDNSGELSQYDVTPGDGTLTPKDPATVGTGTQPSGVAVSPDGLSAYVANGGSNTISQYDVELDGALAPKDPATIGAGSGPSAITLSADGESAYVTNFNSDNVSEYHIGPDGTLAPKDPATVGAGDGPTSIALSPDGGSAYATNFNATDVSQYGVDANGVLSPLQPAKVAAGDRPHAVAVALADAPDASVSPASLNFGGVNVDVTSSSQTVTVSNAADAVAPLDVGQAQITGTDAGDFSIVAGMDGCSNLIVDPGVSCTIDVEFTPSSLGGKSAALSIPSNDLDSPATVALSGNGTDPDQSVSPALIPFGSQLVGSASAARTVTLTNGADATSEDVIGTATIVGGNANQFSIATDDCSNTTVAIGAACEIAVRFAPSSTGAKQASLSIPSDDLPISPATVALSGTGTEPDESVSPSALRFGGLPIGENSTTRTVTVANGADATAALQVGSIALAGPDPDQFDVVFDNCSNRAVEPGERCQLGLRFAPTAGGSASASVRIPSNGSASPVSVSLGGTGTPPSNVFTLGNAKKNKKKGTAKLTVEVPGEGVLDLAGKNVKPATDETIDAGGVILPVKSTGRAKRKLKKKGKARVTLEVTFTPTGGAASTQDDRLKLVKRKRRR